MNSSHQLSIFGSSPYAELVAHYFATDSEYSPCRYVVDAGFPDYRANSLPLPTRVLTEGEAPDHEQYLFIALGYRSMRARKQVFERFNNPGVKLVNFVSSHARVDSTVSLGVNNIIMPGAVIEPFVTIGDNNVIWSNATVCHDTALRSHCFVAANATIGGHCEIGDLSFLGFSSVVGQHCCLADETLVAATAFISRNTESCTRYQGVPAKPAGMHRLHGIRVSP